MKILFTVKETAPMAYVPRITSDLRSWGVDVVCSVDAFKNPDPTVDIVHVQWPEALTGWKEIDSEQVSAIRQSIPRWLEHSKLVVTRHNYLPHRATKVQKPLFENLYNTFYGQADAIVHLAEQSREELRQPKPLHPSLPDCRHEVIPIPIYENFPTAPSREDARQELGIPRDTEVVLAFGDLRTEEEITFTLRAFDLLDSPKKLLLAPQLRIGAPPSARFTPSWWRWRKRAARLRRDDSLRVDEGFLPDERVPSYFAAANVVLLPRLRVLSSAQVPLSFQFSRVVTGPNVGNPGEFLNLTGNPVFTKGSSTEAAQALRQGIELDRNGELGEQNRFFAEKHWLPKPVSKAHFELYAALLAGR